MNNEYVSFSEALCRRVLIFDGAMGTELYNRNVQVNRCYDELCLSQADLIAKIHADYCQAGADVLITNTFGANRRALGQYGLEDKLEAINKAGVELARNVADKMPRQVFIGGSVGPSTGNSRDGLIHLYREQITSLLEGKGADFIAFETQPTREALETCVIAMKSFPEVPYILSFTVYSDLESVNGEALDYLMTSFEDDVPTPAAWGINCGIGPSAMLEVVEKAVHLTSLPVIVQPNAGMPREVAGRQLYMCSPDYIAGYAKRYLASGVRGIGGCCGTGPEHIREIAQRIKPLERENRPVIELNLGTEVTVQKETDFAQKSRLAWKISQKQWVTTIEILPPRGYDMGDTIEKAKHMYRRGVDAINLPDGPRASSRLSPLMTAVKIIQEAQIEPILHFCCRDRNLIGMQADLLACAAAGVRNILFVTGDPPKLGDYPFASGVFDVDSIGLCALQKRMNQGIDLGGQALVPKTHAVIGVGVDPTMPDQEREIKRFHEKAEAGAEFAITQPVFDSEALLRFFDRIQACNVPVLAGIWPLASYRNASFLQNEVPGVTIPENIMARMASCETKEEQRRVGIEIAREMVSRIADRIAGVQVSAPFGNIETALQVIET